MVLIIAEAGVNHNGSFIEAKKLIDAAVNCKADIIKFQSFRANDLCIPETKKAKYQENNGKNNETQFEMLKELELSLQEQEDLKIYSEKKNIEFLTSGFDLDSLNFIKNLDLKRYKIPSGEITNLPYLRFVGSQNKPVILSTGMSDMKDIGNALKYLISSGTSLKNITLLHCLSEYPAPLEEVNLRAMISMRNKFKVNVGYSDHTLGIEVSLAAAALGATVIEKHITLDKNSNGPDHRASLDPNEFRKLVEGVRNISKALGSKEKKITNSELKNISIVRKSLVAKVDIKKGDLFTEANLCTKRPGTGISPMLWDKVIGSRSLKNFKANDFIIF